MPTIDQAVDFLIKNDALELGASPWPAVEPDQEAFGIDWDELFPPVARDNQDRWEFSPTDEELKSLEEALGNRPPPAQKEQVGLLVRSFDQPEWDICAWYQPVHYFGHEWGIFIKEDCVMHAAMMIARFVPRSAIATKPLKQWMEALVRAAVYIYFLHEHYHHKVESLGFRLHVVERKSAYLPYHSLVYAKNKGSDNQLEEALANADCYHRLNTKPYAQWLTPVIVKATKEYLMWQFPQDPPGYRKAVDYLKKQAFDQAENCLQARVREANQNPVQPVGEWDLAPRMTQSFLPVTSNIWAVIPKGSHSRLPRRPSMPTRTCSTADMIKLYEQAEYKMVDGGKGSHVKLKKPGAPTMILPGDRKELSPGVAKTALRVLGDYNLNDLQRLVNKGLRQI